MALESRDALSGVVKFMVYLGFGASFLWGIVLLGGLVLTLRYADDFTAFTMFPLKMDNMYRFDAPEFADLPEEVVTQGRTAILELDGVYGVYNYRRIPRSVILAYYLGEGVLLALFLFVLVQLAKLFENLGRGRFFESDNPRFLGYIGWAMVAGGVFKPCYKLFILLYYSGAIEVRGTSLPWEILVLELRPEFVLAGAVLLGIAEAFRRGVAMREEQELTV